MVNFSYNPIEKETTASFSGRLDTLAVQKMDEMIRENLPESPEASGEKISFDLKDVEYICSSFIRICVATAKQTGSGRFSVRNCQPFIKKTFQLSGLVDILNVS